MTLNLADTSVAKSRPSVSYAANLYDDLCFIVVVREWQPMLDLEQLFDCHTLSGLAATIEYVFLKKSPVITLTVATVVSVYLLLFLPLNTMLVCPILAPLR